MSGKARQSESYSSALFPCLAVLLCSIGALIFILVVSVVNSYASAKTEAEAEIEALVEVSDTMHTVSEELAARREKLKSEVERRRRELAGIEDHISRLQGDVERLLSKARAMDSQVELSDAERHERQRSVQELREQIDAKKKELAKEIEKKKNSKPAFAIIPYSGGNGTSRRPVYLECRREGVVVQPEGIVISLEELKPPHGPGNPLDATLRVLRNAYQQKDATFGITTPPYPLLVVRPDGIQSYALARAAMSGWDDQFGYELVDQEMKLTFPEGLPGLSSELTTALNVSRQRQAALLASLSRSGASRRMLDDDEEIDWGDAKGSESPANSRSWGDENRASGSAQSSTELDSSGRWKMVQQLNPGQVASSGGQGSSPYGGSAPTSTPNGNADGVPRNSGAPFLNAANGIPKSYGTYGGADLSGEYVTAGAGQGSFLPWGGIGGNSQGASSGSQKGLADAVGQSGNASGVASSGAANNSMNNSGGTGEAGGSTNQGGAGGNGGAGSSNGGAGGGASSAGSGNTISMGGGSSRANSFSSGTNNALPGSAASTDPYTGQPSTSDGQPQIQGVSMDVGNSSSSQSKSSRPQSEQSKKKKRNESQPPPRNDGDLKPISVSAGRDWATTRTEGKATPVLRPIRIIALSDQWLLRSDTKQLKHDAVIKLEDGPTAASKQLEQAIRERVDSWGLSLPGGYWCPTITIEYANDASLSVERLQRLLDGSGVEIKLVPLQSPVPR